MPTTTPCTIKLLNRTYQLRCPNKEEQHLQLAAQKLDSLMRKNQKKFPALDDNQLLLLAALEISHASVLLEATANAPSKDINGFIESLEERLQTIATLGKKNQNSSR